MEDFRVPYRCPNAAVHSHVAPAQELAPAAPAAAAAAVSQGRQSLLLESLVAPEVHGGPGRRERERRRVRGPRHALPPRDVHELENSSYLLRSKMFGLLTKLEGSTAKLGATISCFVLSTTARWPA